MIVSSSVFCITGCLHGVKRSGLSCSATEWIDFQGHLTLEFAPAGAAHTSVGGRCVWVCAKGKFGARVCLSRIEAGGMMVIQAVVVDVVDRIAVGGRSLWWMQSAVTLERVPDS